MNGLVGLIIVIGTLGYLAYRRSTLTQWALGTAALGLLMLVTGGSILWLLPAVVLGLLTVDDLRRNWLIKRLTDF